MSLLAIKSEKMKKMNKKKKMDKTGNHSIREFLVKMSTVNSSEARRISQSRENVQEKENDTSMKGEKGQRNNDRNPLQERTNDFSEEGQSNSNLQQVMIKNMSEGPPNKKTKQTDIRSSFQKSPKKKTTTDSGHGETPQARNNAKQETMAQSSETEEKFSKHLKQRAEEQQKHTFRFSFGYKNSNQDPVFVSCDTSMTVLDALKKSDTFQLNKDTRDPKKQIVIQRDNKTAVKTDFPCCLINKNELLNITFVKMDSTMEKTSEFPKLSLPRTDFVTFFVKSCGKKSLKYTLPSKELREAVDYVCVYALEGQNVKTALEQDGRFNKNIFQKLCVLSLLSKEKTPRPLTYEMSVSVNDLKGKAFQIIAKSMKQPKRKLTKDKTENASAVDSEKYGKRLPTTCSKQKTMQVKETKSSSLPTTGQVTLNPSGESGGLCHTEIEVFLRTSFENIMTKLTQGNNFQVQKFFQEDYDKGIQCFTEVNKVRQIMTLSDSVCLIEVDHSPTGTGFLAFDRFILTNAHVIKDFVNPTTRKLLRPLKAKFNYEVVGSAAKVLSVKDDIVACDFELDDRRRFYDFALLELEATPDNCPQLFKRYIHSPPPNRGGIYIVGHPGCGVKKMDPCLIIEPEKQLQSINKHISDNMSCPYVSLQCWPYLHQNRITYDTCMLHGSSGSPVFDDRCNLIGMHTGGFHYKEDNTDRSVIEYAYSMQSIVEGIVEHVRSRRCDILNLLSEFDSIKAQFKLEKTEDTSGAIMPIQQQDQCVKEEKMDVD